MGMTITRALTRIKSIDKLLEKDINNYSTPFVTTLKNNSKVNGFESNEEYTEFIKSKFQSMNDLIAERSKLKNAILISNANTKVNIGNKEYTVAGAIEMKSFIEQKTELLGRMKEDYAIAYDTMVKENEKAKSAADNYIINIFGKDKATNKNISEEIEIATKAYLDRNSYTLCDPINIKKAIDSLEREIIEFKDEVDLALSESNAMTTIEIE